MNSFRLLVAVALPLTLVAWGPAPSASALDCVGPSALLEDASQAFTGRITDARNGRIQVEVSEVWWGGPVAEQVWLDVELVLWTGWAGPDGAIPDGLTTPEEWVVAPRKDGTVNPCVMWELQGHARAELLEHRPVQPAAPSPATHGVDQSGPTPGNLSDDEVGQTVWWPWAAGAALVALIAGAGLWVGRRMTVTR